MNVLIKRLITLILIGGLVFHFICICVYNFPIHLKNPKLQFISKIYTYPYFHQTWNLFVPAPQMQFTLYTRYKSDNKWYAWDNMLQETIYKSRNYPLSGNEAQVLLLSNSVSFLYYSLPHNTSLYLKEPKDINFQIVKRAVSGYIKNYKHMGKINEFEVLLTCRKNQVLIAYYFRNLS